MIYRKIGKTGMNASVVAFGTFPLGGWMWGGCDENGALGAICAALDAGVNLFDCAPLYGWGAAEELLGRAMKGRRDKFLVATKCGLRWNGDGWTPDVGEFHFRFDDKGLAGDGAPGVCRRWLAPESVRWEVEQSLRRLGTDHIDIYFTHAPDATTPVEETIEVLLRLKSEGKIRAVGCSNVTPALLKQYLASGELDALQEKFNLLDRRVEQNELLDDARSGQVSFFAYTPLENGLLTGNIKPDQTYADGDFRKNSPRFAPDNVRRVNEMLERLRPLAEDYHITPAQLAVAWNFSRYDKGHVLCGMRRLESVRENVKAGNVLLTTEETDYMARVADEYEFASDALAYE